MMQMSDIPSLLNPFVLGVSVLLFGCALAQMRGHRRHH